MKLFHRGTRATEAFQDRMEWNRIEQNRIEWNSIVIQELSGIRDWKNDFRCGNQFPRESWLVVGVRGGICAQPVMPPSGGQEAPAGPAAERKRVDAPCLRARRRKGGGVEAARPPV